MPADWTQAHAEAIATRAIRELEALVGVSTPSGDARAAEEVAAIAAAADGSPVVTEIRQADGRAENQHEQLSRLEEEADCPIHELPFLFTEQLRPEDVAGLADVLAPAVGE